MEFLKTKKIILSAIFSALFSCFCFCPVFAEGGVIEISPVIKEINLTPGHSYNETMTVKNIGDEVLNFSVTVSPYQVNNGDYAPSYNTYNDWTKITEWISVPKGEVYSLAPGEYKDINYTIDVPLDVPAGAQYAVISASSDDGTKKDSAVKIINNVGMIISAEVAGDTRSSGEIVSKNIPGFLLQPPISATFSFSNTGNVNATASCSMRITNFFNGSEVYSNAENPKKVVVIPDTTRNSELSWENSPFLGIFRVNLSLEYLNDTLNFSKIVILCPLWFIVIFLLIITAAIIVIVIKFKKRHYRSNKKKFSF